MARSRTTAIEHEQIDNITVTPIAPRTVGASIEPNIGAKKGKKASGCPVSGLIVKGTADANPFTSAGLT